MNGLTEEGRKIDIHYINTSINCKVLRLLSITWIELGYLVINKHPPVVVAQRQGAYHCKEREPK